MVKGRKHLWLCCWIAELLFIQALPCSISWEDLLGFVVVICFSGPDKLS